MSCLPCDQINCVNKTEEECSVGTVFDVCGCCRVCAKNLGEVCGGPWKVFGTCGKGLECVLPPSPPGVDRFAYEFNAEGVCKKTQN